MPAIKKSDLTLNAQFVLRIGTIQIVEIIENGYSKGDHIYKARFLVNGEPTGLEFADDANDLKFFINTHKVKSK